MGAAIAIHGLSHTYGADGSAVRVLSGLDLEVEGGDYVSLTGPSGAGKTTLLSIIGGLEPAVAGEVRVGGHEVSRLRGDALAAFRRSTVGFVFQHFGLLGSLTALENIELALSLAGVDRQARGRRARELLGAVGLADRADHLPRALSGGERQRVAIARATSNLPGLILADEPTGNLDAEAGERVMQLLESVRSQTGCSLVVVSHNAAIAGRARARYGLAGGALQIA